MSSTRYHLVCEGFERTGINKTQLSLALKQQLRLGDDQLADLMAGRRVVLARNLTVDRARALGRRLKRAGLAVRVESAEANQKLSAEELRRHLLDGGLRHYFAGRYHHPEEELETRFSLVLLAALPVVTYLLLPLIALLLALPLLDPLVWTGQPAAALGQTGIIAALLVPALWLRPPRRRRSGLALDAEAEPLLFELIEAIAYYIGAPRVVAVRLTEAPLIHLHQSPLQWARQRCELEIGLPWLRALTLQQLAGALVHTLAPRAPRLYAWTWTPYRHWLAALAQRQPALARRLSGWAQPLDVHQLERQQAMLQALIGRREAGRVDRIRQRLEQLSRQWPAFDRFCADLDVTPTDWPAWIGPLHTAGGDAEDEEDSVGQFRLTAPAGWVVSSLDGYARALARQEGARHFRVAATRLWRQFRLHQGHRARLAELGVPADALFPPTAQPGGKPKPAQLKRRQEQARKVQEAGVRHLLGLAKQPPKQDLTELSQAWRRAALPFWPAETMQHRNLPLARGLYLALQGAEQIHLWARQPVRAKSDAAALRERQLRTLYRRWLNSLKRLPALPLLAAPPASLAEQLTAGWTEPDQASAEAIAERSEAWVRTLQIYWTLVAVSLLDSSAGSEEGRAAA